MDQIDIVMYSVLDVDGRKAGTVVHTDEVTINGLKNRQHVCQTGLAGNVVVDEHWSE